MQVDLHIHSTASDGTWTPPEVVAAALAAGLGAIAVTDHDSVANVAATHELAVAAGLKFIPGAEICSTKDDFCFHILGYGIDVTNKRLLDLLEHNERLLNSKDDESIKMLIERGWLLDFEEFLRYDYDRRRGGWKALAFLQDKGLCGDVNDFFSRIFTKEHDLGFPVFPSIKEVVDAIHAAGSWHYGAAISHNDGKTTYDSGKGENKSTSLSLYGTWLGDRGHYTDIVLKQGRLSNEYDNYAAAGHTHGDYDAWGTSLSSEYGMKVGLDNGWYVTPQAQLTLMRIGGEDYTTNNGIKVNQDTLESCVGRVGFEMGKTISDKGSIYAKASLLHEFAGNADTYLNLNSISNSYSQDIGGTWYEAGLGFNFKTTDNSYVYADVVKTFGDDIKTPWQWNVGARWSF